METVLNDAGKPAQDPQGIKKIDNPAQVKEVKKADKSKKVAKPKKN